MWQSCGASPLSLFKVSCCSDDTKWDRNALWNSHMGGITPSLGYLFMMKSLPPLLFVARLNLGTVVLKAAAGVVFWQGQACLQLVFVGLNGSWHPPCPGWRSCTWTVASRLDWDKAADVLLWDCSVSRDIAQQLPPSSCWNLNLAARTAAVSYSPKLLVDFTCRPPSPSPHWEVILHLAASLFQFASPISSPYDKIFLLCLGCLCVPPWFTSTAIHGISSPASLLHPWIPALPSAFAIPRSLQSMSPALVSYALPSSWWPIQSLQHFEQPRGLPSLWLPWRKL